MKPEGSRSSAAVREEMAEGKQDWSDREREGMGNYIAKGKNPREKDESISQKDEKGVEGEENREEKKEKTNFESFSSFGTC